MLQLPTVKGGAPILGGAAANAYFEKLDHLVGRPARSAHFAATGAGSSSSRRSRGSAWMCPARPRPSSRRQSRPTIAWRTSRSPPRSPAGPPPRRTRWGSRLVSSYETIYGGIANRIHNVELVAHLVDNKLIAPGATFSFNKTTGARTAAKGFVEAPVIINGELQTGLGGGVCQVSTTVFNAAYEAGLPITARTNHALYISHYPLGRDATVDYPDIDLKFVNDTSHWLLLRTFVGESSLVVSLYGTPQHRRVVTNTAPLKFVGPPPVEKTLDPSLAPGRARWRTPARTRIPPRSSDSSTGPTGSSVGQHLVLELPLSPELLLVGPTPKAPPKAKPKKTPPRVEDDDYDSGESRSGGSQPAIASRSHCGVRVGAASPCRRSRAPSSRRRSRCRPARLCTRT